MSLCQLFNKLISSSSYASVESGLVCSVLNNSSLCVTETAVGSGLMASFSLMVGSIAVVVKNVLLIWYSFVMFFCCFCKDDDCGTAHPLLAARRINEMKIKEQELR